jgi:hypothetical protein
MEHPHKKPFFPHLKFLQPNGQEQRLTGINLNSSANQKKYFSRELFTAENNEHAWSVSVRKFVLSMSKVPTTNWSGATFDGDQLH